MVNTHPKRELRLLVLIPHRDVRALFRRWSGGLFSAGLFGAWAFPWAVPLACLSRPLLPAELREAAFAIRKSLAGGTGKIRTGAAALCPLPESFLPPPESGGRGTPALYGPRIEPGGLGEALQGAGASKILGLFSPLILGAALIEGPEGKACPRPLPPPPEAAFRAAALANMIYRSRPAGEGASFFEWQTGRLRWLPSAGAGKTKRNGL
jgi:hypothetical protein